MDHKPPELSLEKFLSPMLPEGAPVPELEEQLDYSFAIEYQGSPVSHAVPRAELVEDRRVRPTSLNIDSRKRAQVAAASLIKDSDMHGSSSTYSKGKHAQQGGMDSPDSRLSRSRMNSLSRKSSSSEIEELNVQFSAAVSAAASALPSPSAYRSVSVGESHSKHFNSNLESSEFHRSLSVPRKPRGDEPGVSSPAMPPSEPEVVVPVKKSRECFRCRKSRLFQEKETCLVCTARYCRSCILAAMGSMPEGRKCVRCVGHPIHESRRPSVGKPSGVLRTLLSPLEIQHLMRTEKDCLGNQLRPEQLYVNGRALSPHEMCQLLGCSNPPPKLKPGRYWYDKSSGLWGREGEKPSRIVTAELKVGGTLKPDASNGATQVHINCRQITKSELKMLKLAGVQCPPGTYLFLSPDGSYMEEGQNKFKGNIWNKASMRLMYSLFSLPTPRGGSRLTSKRDRSLRYLPELKTVSKLLLLGHEGSGRSTVFKQVKFLYNGGFEQRELEKYKEMIQTYIYKYLVILLDGRERFAEEESGGQVSSSGEASKGAYSLETRLKNLADWFLDITADGSIDRYFPAATREYATSVEDLWHDPAIQATFKRKDELHNLPDVAGEFLERVVELSTNEYEPGDHDVLYAEGLTQGSALAEIDFSLPEKEQTSGAMNEASSESPTSGRYQLIRVGSIGLNEGKKWLSMFEDVRALIFTVALSEFDQLCVDGAGALRNKLLLSKELFQDIASRPCFKGMPLILFLNKYDKFEEKIMRGVPLTSCEWFSDFSPVGVPHSTQAQQAYTYVVHKFKKLVGDRKLYTFQLNALERNLVASAFQYVKHILKHEESKAAGWMMAPEDSSYCTDLSSYSLHSSARQENGNSWDR